VIRHPRQIPLELPLEPRFGREDFLVSPSNEEAWSLFERWPDWPGRMLLLVGPGGAGKSHLGAIWAKEAHARTLSASSLPLADLPALAQSGAVLLEDAGPSFAAETELFHLINLMRETGGYLAITSHVRPDLWDLKIPDLLSRLRLAPVVEIAAPDDALVRAVLVKLFIDRQLIVDTSVIEFLALRIERSIDAARRVVDLIDREALARGRPVTRPIASEVLMRLEAAGQD
jgi:chromosomal replication initiation ATPase DnaA